MGIEDRLQEDLKSSMKSGEKIRVDTIRMLRSQIKNAAIAKGEPLTEGEIASALAKEAKRRKEALELYRQGGREDLSAAEARGIEIIEAYLPRAMAPEEIEAVISEALVETGATSLKDMGRVMSAVMARIKGSADGSLVQTLVRKKLV
ncbi:GatB/YqeY domain-containing protein [bacterium]|nr:GatB/YqeY domain-containing protein [bacterium]